MRIRAITFPRRAGSASGSLARYPSTAEEMSTVRDSIPKASMTS